MSKLPEEKLSIVGRVAAVFFQNPSNFYKVILVDVEETNSDYKDDQIVVTGSLGDIQDGEGYRFFGDFVEHARYGLQFQVETYQKDQPTSENGLINYFSSDKFPGIGKITASKIVEAIGAGGIEGLLENPTVLEQVPTLNEKKRQMVIDNVRLNYGMDQVIVGLSKYGFGSQLSFAIYQTYRNEALDVIHENPYQLVEDIEGIGFKKADQLAEQLGIAPTSTQRMRAAIIHQIFQHSVQTGDTYCEAQMLLGQTIDLLERSRPVEIPPEELANVIIQLVEEGKIQQDGTKIYESSLYFAERGIATNINRLLEAGEAPKLKQEKIDKLLRKIEKRLGISYGSSQEVAIKEAIKSPLFILTGGPGTGKTTVINGIVQLFAELYDLSLEPSEFAPGVGPILLAAPTGRAAKRMNETTDLPSSTIHRMLGLTGREKVPTEEAKELEGGLLIVDEMSMVDTWLANTLLKSIPDGMQVIFVGDKDQLPSVGPGQVLHDLLQIDKLPKRELTEIYRQGDDSTIISLAHEIKNGALPPDFTTNKADRSFFASDAYHIEPLIAKIVERAKAKGFTPQDIQLLAPMYRGPAGIDQLNKMMQEIFNPNPDGKKKEVSWNDTVYRIGDKVLQLVNAPEDNVFNGDMGQIVGITYAKDSEDKVDELTLQFDATEVTYKKNEWNKITLSYCCSIHKAQGSEFKMVILPMVHQFQRMLQRNLLYTAITRSKELLILLGEEKAYRDCVRNESASRLTTLKERILGIETPLPVAEAEAETETETTPVEKPVKPAPTTAEATNVELLPEIEPVSNQPTAAEAPANYRLSNELVAAGSVDPMIGMGQVTPFDFLK